MDSSVQRPEDKASAMELSGLIAAELAVPEGWSSSCPWSVSYCCAVVAVHCNVIVAVPLLCCWISPCFVSYCLLSVSLILSVISAKHYGYLQDRLQNAMVI